MEPEILALEHSFLKVPHEQVVKSSKSTQQLVDSEIDLVSAKLEAIVAEASTTPPRVLAKDIDGLLQQLLNLKQQVNGLAEVEKHLLETAALRIEHLNVGLKAAEGTREATLWNNSGWTVLCATISCGLDITRRPNHWPNSLESSHSPTSPSLRHQRESKTH
eukprot:m.133996 g.133996  ORF g.133996 m.133996 type:complete len:162 (+) comp11373_c0_seq2:186-671(+)